EQINHAGVKVVELVALKIEHTHNFVPHHEGNRDFRPGSLHIRDITVVFTHVGGVNGTLELGRGAGNALAQGNTEVSIGAGTPEMCANVEFLLVFVEEQHRAIAELKVVADDG